PRCAASEIAPAPLFRQSSIRYGSCTRRTPEMVIGAHSSPWKPRRRIFGSQLAHHGLSIAYSASAQVADSKVLLTAMTPRASSTSGASLHRRTSSMSPAVRLGPLARHTAVCQRPCEGGRPPPQAPIASARPPGRATRRRRRLGSAGHCGQSFLVLGLSRVQTFLKKKGGGRGHPLWIPHRCRWDQGPDELGRSVNWPFTKLSGRKT